MPGTRPGRDDYRAYLVAVPAGCLVGLLGGAFRWCLEHADRLRGSLLETADGLDGPGWLVPVALAAAGAALACAIARQVPYAAGSGIQHVEAVWQEQAHTVSRPLRLLAAKFTGGLIAIGSGLVLGREGPIVHMGASIAVESGRRTRLGPDDARLLHAALSGAGLAAAFSAPLGGLLFVCEELTRTVRPRLVLLTVIGTAAAVACSRLVVGDAPIFPVPGARFPPVSTLPLFLLFGVAAGMLGAAYSGLVVGMLAVSDRLTRVPAVVRAGAIGSVVGLLMASDPLLAGGGDPLSQRLLAGDSPAVAALAGYLVVRFVAGPLSYAAGTPGGLFAPLLALGALWGALVHTATAPLLPAHAVGPGAFAVAGTAALFAAVVRAPVTGVVLVVELTGATPLIVPALIACFAATLTADRLESAPIYDSLRRRMLERP
ncbi:ClC family H(+)/Cl(-) exchange transporter [Streptomyces sp. NBC_00239]|uniref:ClC family H(+)/Cl(-) exchange transporter n=1 Tax=Streptomyces sp. NBC_00239 TaxID=2903640 RepID=UPI002E2B6C4B|nr:ClC family H(+)/Cl(-) exchange transporter [Streptomyces sp. NBC_00239]